MPALNAEHPEEEADDIQGLLLFGYRNWPYAHFALMKIADVNACREWLAKAVQSGEPLFHTAALERRRAPRALNIAFTSSGLRRLGLDSDILGCFSPEFYEGMSAPHRTRILSDYDESAPAKWSWGYGEDRTPDLLLLMYAQDSASIDTMFGEHTRGFARNGLALIEAVKGHPLEGDREHFGFRDGIANPIIKGRGAGENRGSFTLCPGEFVLGYQNEYNRVPFSPTIRAETDPTGHLPFGPDGSTLKDLGRNGSYLVVRHISQDVYSFWSFVDAAAKSMPVGPSNNRLGLAAKIVGRWPNGASLVTHSDVDPPAPASEELNKFMYAKEDPNGERCPFGAHVRRANPRDWLLGDSPDEGLKVANRHQLMRRGRSYGPPLCASFDPAEVLATGPDRVDRGLLFMCLNADIARQFEFVQQTWINNSKFAGLYGDPDPLTGAPLKNASPDFTIPQCPIRTRVSGLPQFTTVRGGAYFFMPSIRTIRYLSRAVGTTR